MLSSFLGPQLDNGGQAVSLEIKQSFLGLQLINGEIRPTDLEIRDQFLGLQINNDARPTCFGTRQIFLDVLGLQFNNSKYQYPDLFFSKKIHLAN